MSDNVGRWTTPELTIHVPVDMREANVYITFKQDGFTVLEKDETQFTVNEDTLVVPLTQADTGRFKVGPIKFQIKYVFPDGSSDFSNPLETEIVEAFKNGALTYVQRGN